MTGMTEISPTAVVSSRDGVIDAIVGTETVLLTPDGSRYHGLDPVGSRVWRLLDGDRTVDDVCRILADEFEVAPDRCVRDVTSFLDDLAEHDLVVFR